MANSKHPAVVTVLRLKAHLVRQVALEQQLTYEEAPVPDEEDLVRFFFGSLDEKATRRLALAIPRQAYAFQGIFSNPIQANGLHSEGEP
jgi:hypothetical protein